MRPNIATHSILCAAVILGGAGGCSSAAPPSAPSAADSTSAATEAAVAPQPFEALLNTAQDNQPPFTTPKSRPSRSA